MCVVCCVLSVVCVHVCVGQGRAGQSRREREKIGKSEIMEKRNRFSEYNTLKNMV